jgi:hypothetical protein
MEKKNRRPALLKDTTRSVLFFLIINIATVISPAGLMLAPIIVPVLLLYIRAQHGQNAFALASLVGVMPYFVFGGTVNALAALAPIFIMTGGLYAIKRYQLSWSKALTVAVLAIFLGILLNGYFSIYVVQGSNLSEFSLTIAENVKSQLQSALGATGYEVPMSQQQLIDELTASITPEFVQEVIPTMVISWSLMGGYLLLRLSRRFLKIGRTPKTNIPFFAMLGTNPLMLAFFIIMAILGASLSDGQPRWSSLLYNTGYGVSMFLGIVGTLSLIWWTLSVKFRFGRLSKVLLVLITLFYMVGDWMILVAIVDSVFDFRNISGKSLWHWLTYTMKSKMKKED